MRQILNSGPSKIPDSITGRRVVLSFFLFLFLLAAMAEARPSNTWRICFNHRAKSFGVIVFHVVPEGGSPYEVRVEVEEGWSENTVAKAAVVAFRKQLPPDRFKIKRDSGEDMVVKKSRGTPDFDLHLMNSSVANVHIKIKRR